MNTLESVKFQESESESKSQSMDSSSVNIKIPEMDISIQSSAQNGKKMKENEHEILKTGRNRWLKLVSCCLAFVFVMILLSGLIYLGFRKQENGEGVKSSRGPIFGQWNSTHFPSGHNFQAQRRTKAQEQENPNPNPEMSGTESEQVDIVVGLLETHFKDIDALVSDKVKEVTSKISGEISQLGHDLKGQIAALGQNNRSREAILNSLADELRKVFPSFKEQMMTMAQRLHFSTNSSTPLLTTTTTPPTRAINLTTPTFYYGTEFKGVSFQPSEGWEDGCVNLPRIMDNWSKSVDLGGHCLFLCGARDCREVAGFYGPLWRQECIELRPNSPGVNNLGEIGQYGHENQISSFRLCQKK